MTEREYGVMMHRFPDELHRGPWTEEQADNFIKGAVEDGFKPDVFYKVSRPVGEWERHA